MSEELKSGAGSGQRGRAVCRVISGAAWPGRCGRLVLTPSVWAADGRRGGAVIRTPLRVNQIVYAAEFYKEQSIMCVINLYYL